MNQKGRNDVESEMQLGMKEEIGEDGDRRQQRRRKMKEQQDNRK